MKKIIAFLPIIVISFISCSKSSDDGGSTPTPPSTPSETPITFTINIFNQMAEKIKEDIQNIRGMFDKVRSMFQEISQKVILYLFKNNFSDWRAVKYLVSLKQAGSKFFISCVYCISNNFFKFMG